MKTKIITALIAFITTFGFSIAVTGLFIKQHKPTSCFTTLRTNNGTQQKIFQLLQRDIRNGRERFGKLSGTYSSLLSDSNITVYSKAVNEYAEKSANLDDTELPLEFQLAWREHMKAWREHAGFIEGCSRLSEKLEFDFTDDKIVNTHLRQEREISRTWYEVLRIAEEYNAVPYGAY
jgi:hypothetical protein